MEKVQKKKIGPLSDEDYEKEREASLRKKLSPPEEEEEKAGLGKLQSAYSLSKPSPIAMDTQQKEDMDKLFKDSPVRADYNKKITEKAESYRNDPDEYKQEFVNRLDALNKMEEDDRAFYTNELKELYKTQKDAEEKYKDSKNKKAWFAAFQTLANALLTIQAAQEGARVGTLFDGLSKPDLRKMTQEAREEYNSVIRDIEARERGTKRDLTGSRREIFRERLKAEADLLRKSEKARKEREKEDKELDKETKTIASMYNSVENADSKERKRYQNAEAAIREAQKDTYNHDEFEESLTKALKKAKYPEDRIQPLIDKANELRDAGKFRDYVHEEYDLDYIKDEIEAHQEELRQQNLEKRIEQLSRKTKIPPDRIRRVIEGFQEKKKSRADNQEKWPNAPKVGEIKDGYKYVGGDPSLQESWKKVK